MSTDGRNQEPVRNECPVPPDLPPLPPPPPTPPPPTSSLLICRKSAEPPKEKDEIQLSVVDEIRDTIQRLPAWRRDPEGDNGRRIWLACNTHVKHVSQEGPTCGLVAVCMSANMLQVPGKSLQMVLAAAKHSGYTLQGEMFSAHNTMQLAEEEFHVKGQLLADGLQSHRLEILVHLSRGSPVLVPYDADYNNEPSYKKGHRAHWAVLTGFLIVTSQHKCKLRPSWQLDTQASDLYHLPPPWLKEDIANLPEMLQDGCEVYVFARQGKSRLLGAWLYDTLVASNENLKEYDPTKFMMKAEYIFPEEGLKDGLANKAILLLKKT